MEASDQINVEWLDGIERQLFGEMIGIGGNVGAVFIVGLDFRVAGIGDDGFHRQEGVLVDEFGTGAWYRSADITDNVPGVLGLAYGPDRQEQEKKKIRNGRKRRKFLWTWHVEYFGSVLSEVNFRCDFLQCGADGAELDSGTWKTYSE